MISKEETQLRLEIAKSYYLCNLTCTSPNEYEVFARKSFDLADTFLKVYKEIGATKESHIPSSAYMKGGE